MENNIYYTMRDIYGIKLYSRIPINDICIILFEQKYNMPMSTEMMNDVKVFYENLDETEKANIKFKKYIKCKSIDNEEDCMIWLNISLTEFIHLFTFTTK